jgi:hypothetical protein
VVSLWLEKGSGIQQEVPLINDKIRRTLRKIQAHLEFLSGHNPDGTVARFRQRVANVTVFPR